MILLIADFTCKINTYFYWFNDRIKRGAGNKDLRKYSLRVRRGEENDPIEYPEYKPEDSDDNSSNTKQVSILLEVNKMGLII